MLSLVSATLSLAGPAAARASAVDTGATATATPSTTTTQTSYTLATSTSVRRSGSWATVYSSAYIGGRALRSGGYGAVLRFTFTGTGISLIGPKSTRGGKAKIYIDGHYIKTVSEYSTTAYSRAVLYSRSFTTYSRHTITVYATTSRFTANAFGVRRPVVTSSTPVRVVTVGPSITVSAFRALAADLSVGVIEMTAGTYHNWREANLPDRTGYPLTIRPAAGATVVFDAAADSNYPDHAFGFLHASYITLDGTPGRFVFQHYLLAQDGMFLLMYASHITIKGLTFTNIAGNSASNSQSTHLFYVSDSVSYLDIENVVASHITAADEPGGVYALSGIQLYTGGSGTAINHVTVRNFNITGCNWGVVVRNASTSLLFDGVTTTNCGRGGVYAVLDFGLNNTGTVSNTTTTGSYVQPVILGAMTNGGGNSFH